MSSACTIEYLIRTLKMNHNSALIDFSFAFIFDFGMLNCVKTSYGVLTRGCLTFFLSPWSLVAGQVFLNLC